MNSEISSEVRWAKAGLSVSMEFLEKAYQISKRENLKKEDLVHLYDCLRLSEKHALHIARKLNLIRKRILKFFGGEEDGD